MAHQCSQLCQVQCFVPDAASPQLPTSAAAAAAAARGASRWALTSQRIQKSERRSSTSTAVVVDKILENQAELMRQARIVPEQENGKVSAFGCSAFGRTRSRTLGMENGDRLEKINGFDMTSPRSARAYARLRTATFDGVGQPPRARDEPRLQHQVNSPMPEPT